MAARPSRSQPSAEIEISGVMVGVTSGMKTANPELPLLVLMMQIIMTIFLGLETLFPSLKRSNAVKPVPGDAVPGRATVEGDAAESSPVSVSVGVLAPREGAEVSDM